MTNLMQIVSGLKALDQDVVDGVENNFVGKIPGWKMALVSFTENILDLSITSLKYRLNYPKHENPSTKTTQNTSTTSSTSIFSFTSTLWP
jgi:hypothetical protein